MDNVKLLIQEVENLKNKKEFKKALSLLQESLSKYNDDYRLYEEIADIYLYEWKYLKAQKAIDFALDMHNDSATWNYLKWFILLSRNRAKEATTYLEKSNKLMPNNAEVLRNLGWAYTQIEREIKWILILRRALNINPSDNLIAEDLAMALIWNWEIREWNQLLEKIWKDKIPS